jgi:hypothetical protein
VKLDVEAFVVEAFKVCELIVVDQRVAIVPVTMFRIFAAKLPRIVALDNVVDPSVEDPELDILVEVMLDEFRLVVVALVKVPLVLFRLVKFPVVPVI